jgi:hypothetical protein
MTLKPDAGKVLRQFIQIDFCIIRTAIGRYDQLNIGHVGVLEDGL